jgi:hypothetical protein
MATMSPASASSMRLTLDAAEGEDPRDAALLDRSLPSRPSTFTIAWFGLIEPANGCGR